MTGSLVRKELQSLAPFLALVLFFNLLNWGDIMLTSFPDQYDLSKLLETGDSQFLLFVVAFALAASLLVREADDHTLAFLDALPISRTRVFLTKTALALGVLWLLPLSDMILRFVLYSWSRTSLEPQVQWSPLLGRAFLDCAAGFVYLSLGLAMSFLRRFSLLLLGLLVCGFLLLRELQAPFIQLLDIFSLPEPVFEGRHWLLPWTKLTFQTGLGVACLAIAFGAFQMTGDAAARLADRAQRRRGLMVLGGAATATAVLLWFGLLIFWAVKSDRDVSQVQYAAWPTVRARTAQYQFLYPENQATIVARLMDEADATERLIRQFLKAKPVPSIIADLTGSSPHTAGVAHWKRVQLDLNTAGISLEELRATFAHETTHVYIDHEGGDRVSDEFNSTRFFHEGLASYVEYHLFRPSEKLESLRRVAAVMHSRHQLRFEDLVDNEVLTRKYDTDLVYPLGEVFVHALVTRYGADAPGQVVRAFARPDAPKNLQGLELWRDNFQSWGGNLSEVEDALFAGLDQAAADCREFIDSLPRLRGAVESQSGEIVVRVRHEGRAPGAMVCRFRPAADTPHRLYETAYAEETGVFRVSQARYIRGVFWYQLGWQVPGASQAIYEPWVEASL